jgi:hypothetical protein
LAAASKPRNRLNKNVLRAISDMLASKTEKACLLLGGCPRIVAVGGIYSQTSGTNGQVRLTISTEVHLTHGTVNERPASDIFFLFYVFPLLSYSLSLSLRNHTFSYTTIQLHDYSVLVSLFLSMNNARCWGEINQLVSMDISFTSIHSIFKLLRSLTFYLCLFVLFKILILIYKIISYCWDQITEAIES